MIKEVCVNDFHELRFNQLKVGNKFRWFEGDKVLKEVTEAHDDHIVYKFKYDNIDCVYYSLYCAAEPTWNDEVLLEDEETKEEVKLVEKSKLKDLCVGARFRYTNNPYAHQRERTILYKDDIAILYVTARGDYVLVKETDPANLWNEEVEVILCE